MEQFMEKAMEWISSSGISVVTALLILIFGIFYLFLFAPMRKRQKALEQLIANLKKGDRVVTTGGLHGEIAAVKDNVVLVKVADNVKVRVSRSAIAGLENSETSS